MPTELDFAVQEIKEFFQDSVGQFDLIVWTLIIPFFCGSALLNGGDLTRSFIGAGGIILAMFLIGSSIEILIATMRGMRGIGTIIGFLTNGPEMLVLVVGLLSGDIIFAASTPLGSNLMNVILLMSAALLAQRLKTVFSLKPVYTSITFVTTISLAFSFYALAADMYPYWIFLVVATTVVLFIWRPDDPPEMEEDEMRISRVWFIPALFFLILAGFFLDGVVEFASESSKAPKGIIGFVVLSTLTSWPEFKSCLSLLRQNMPVAALLNIVVSNITNLWLAAIGVLIYLLTH